MKTYNVEKYTAYGKGYQGPTTVLFHSILNLLETHMDVLFKNASILDIGCGTGSIAIPLAALGAKVLGIDIHPPSIETAKKNCPFPNAQFEVANAEDLNIVGQFDAIVCTAVIEHLKRPSRLLRRLPPLLKKDGIALIEVPNGFGPYETVTPVVGSILAKKRIATLLRLLAKLFLGYRGTRGYVAPMMNPDSPHVHRLTLHGMKRLLSRNGLSVQHFQGSSFISGVLPFSIVARKFPFLQKVDALVGRMVPIIASGWLIVCRKKDILQ